MVTNNNNTNSKMVNTIMLTSLSLIAIIPLNYADIRLHCNYYSATDMNVLDR